MGRKTRAGAEGEMVRTWLIPLLVSLVLHAGAGYALFALGWLPSPSLNLPSGEVVIRAPAPVPMLPRERVPRRGTSGALTVRFVEAAAPAIEPAARPDEPPPEPAPMPDPVVVAAPDLRSTQPLTKLPPDALIPISLAEQSADAIAQSTRDAMSRAGERARETLSRAAASLEAIAEALATPSVEEAQVEPTPAPEARQATESARTPEATAPEPIDPSSGISRGIDVPPQPHPGNRPPDYPIEALRKHIQGTVYLVLTVAHDGRVESAALERSSGSAILDESALSAARRWRFTPALALGSPTPCAILLHVEFVLRDADVR